MRACAILLLSMVLSLWMSSGRTMPATISSRISKIDPDLLLAFGPPDCRSVRSCVTTAATLVCSASWRLTEPLPSPTRTQRRPHQQGRFGIQISSAAETLGAQAKKVLPGGSWTADSTASSDGKGSVNRQEALQTNVAAVVTQLLPERHLVVEGKQEIRVNFEIRELIVAGIVRPEDIQSDNTFIAARSRRLASPMAAAARSPTCNSRATANR